MDFWQKLVPEPAPLPRFAPVRRRFAADAVDDVPGEVRRQLDAAGARDAIAPGARIAVTAGSRGIDRIDQVTRAAVDYVRDAGGEPFVIAAMGSHGGATPEGQRRVLAGYGITPEAMGCPVDTSMDVDRLGATAAGFDVYCARSALQAGGVIVVNRVKPHSILVGDLGSGLMKMIGIGLAKQAGADAIHVQGVQAHLLPAARMVLDAIPFTAGLALVENSFDRLARIEGCRRDQVEEVDRRLLDLSRRYLPDIPFDPIDVLVVRAMGKDVSGAGMDPNVIGMHRRLGGPPERLIRRIVALDLTEGSHGNAIGVGMADIITERLRAAIDFDATYVNALTSDFLWGIKVPIAAPSDEAALRLAFKPFDPAAARAVIVRDTAHLEALWVSEGLLDEARGVESLEPAGPPEPLRFDGEGNLVLP